MNSLQRSQPLLREQEHQVERGWWLLGGEKTEVSIMHIFFFPPYVPFVVLCAVSCTLSWCFCRGGSVHLQLPPCATFQVVFTASLKRLGPVLACSHLPPSYGCGVFLALSGERSYLLSSPQASTHRQSRVCLCFWKIASVHCALVPVNSLYWTAMYNFRNKTCVKNWCSSARKMGKCLQLDFGYTGKGDNSIFFSLFSLISF